MCVAKGSDLLLHETQTGLFSVALTTAGVSVNTVETDI